MNELTKLLTWRYLTQSTDTDTISTMVSICFLGVFVGSFSLTLVSAIMNGFEHTMHTKMQGIHAHIIIKAYGDHLNVPAIQQIISQQCPTIQASTPTTFEQAILCSPHTGTPQTVLIKAIDPIQEACVTNFKDTITQRINTPIDTHNNLNTLLQNNSVILGCELANTLGVTIGDTIEIIHADLNTIQGRKITFNTTKAIVTALFKTGIDESDSTLMIISFDFLTQLFPESGPTQLNVKLYDTTTENQVIEQLSSLLPLNVFSWKSLYPAIISALVLEKYAMFFILLLIMLIASMNIISLLFMQITQKRANIALLKAMGTPDYIIERIFISIGMGITMTATIPGIILAALTSFIINHYRLICLPDAYYVSYLPTHLEWHMLMIVFIAIFMVSFIAVKIAAYKTRTINISHVLRFEG